MLNLINIHTQAEFAKAKDISEIYEISRHRKIMSILENGHHVLKQKN